VYFLTIEAKNSLFVGIKIEEGEKEHVLIQMITELEKKICFHLEEFLPSFLAIKFNQEAIDFVNLFHS
jgi:hypothetical protein